MPCIPHAQNCTLITLEIRSRVGAHSSKLWPYIGSWAKVRTGLFFEGGHTVSLNTSSHLHQPFSPPEDERDWEDSQGLYKVEKRERELLDIHLENSGSKWNELGWVTTKHDAWWHNTESATTYANKAYTYVKDWLLFVILGSLISCI